MANRTKTKREKQIPKRKQRKISISTKLSVIDQHAKGVRIAAISRSFGLPHSAVTSIIQNKVEKSVISVILTF